MIAAPVQCDVDGIPQGSHHVRVLITTPDEDFQKAAADVVRRFEELYRRLA